VRTPSLVSLLALVGAVRCATQSPVTNGAGRDSNVTARQPEPAPTPHAAALADSDVAAAVAVGKNSKNKKPYWYRGQANCNKWGDVVNGSGWGGIFTIVAQGPYGRIVDASAEAARKYVPYEPANVSVDTRALTLTVAVQQKLEDMKATVVPVEHVVIRGVDENGDEGAVVQPAHIEPLPASFQNLMGAKIETQGVLATFDPQALPQGDLRVVVITARRECHATIHQSDRERIH